MQKSHKQYEQFQQAIDQHAIISVTDANGKITHVNDLFCSISGYSKQELIGYTHRVVRSSEHNESFYIAMWNTISSGNVWHGEVCNRRKNGSLYWVQATIAPILDNNGLPLQYISIRTDITHLKELESQIKIQEEKYHSIFSAVADGILLIGTDKRIIEFNSAVLRILGVHPDVLTDAVIDSEFIDFLGLRWPDGRLISSSDGPLSRALATGNIIRDVTIQLRRPDHQHVWLNIAVEPIYNDTGEMISVAISFSDVSQIQKTQNQLQHSLSQLHATVHAIPDLLFELDREGRCCCPPKGDESLLIIQRDQFTGKQISEILPVEAVTQVMASIVEAESCGNSYGREIWLDVSKGRCCFELSVARKDREPLEAERFIILARDVTLRKSMEADLRRNEQRLTLAVEGAGDGVWEWHIPSGELVFSKLYAAIQGYSEDELAPNISSWVDSVHPEDMPRISQVLQDYLDGKFPTYKAELRLRCKSGNYKWIMCRATITERSEDGKPLRMIGIHTDISHQKENESNLLLFRQIFNASDQCIAVTDPNGRVILVNKSYEEKMGYSVTDMDGLDFCQFAAIDKESGELVRQSVLIEKRPWVGMTRRRSKNGKEFYALNHYGLVQDEQGNLQFIFVIFSDFTDELAKREALTAAVESAEKANRSKSDFLSSMSHELRTPMNAILGFAQILEYDDTLNEDQQENIRKF
ncbi:PAS domain S-box protein [Paludibacterium denitrificans]|uniref:histidine kinase n=1 Tax=Paludibacterium denitrificans TaxID=2675226 RepID=A0A844GAW6_9NEIS|nr:PAS domain S-box protein [Paludibacterium denitrificans]MTD33616.1 PAS domain S-box protein [Paludibacterium denitrificans]